MSKKQYVVTASVEPEGVVLVEVFEDKDEANAFSRWKNIQDKLRAGYSDKMADNPSLQVGYHIRDLHERAVPTTAVSMGAFKRAMKGV